VKLFNKQLTEQQTNSWLEFNKNVSMARTNVEEQQSPAFVNKRKNVTGKQ